MIFFLWVLQAIRTMLPPWIGQNWDTFSWIREEVYLDYFLFIFLKIENMAISSSALDKHSLWVEHKCVVRKGEIWEAWLFQLLEQNAGELLWSPPSPPVPAKAVGTHSLKIMMQKELGNQMWLICYSRYKYEKWAFCQLNNSHSTVSWGWGCRLFFFARWKNSVPSTKPFLLLGKARGCFFTSRGCVVAASRMIMQCNLDNGRPHQQWEVMAFAC